MDQTDMTGQLGQSISKTAGFGVSSSDSTYNEHMNNQNWSMYWKKVAWSVIILLHHVNSQACVVFLTWGKMAPANVGGEIKDSVSVELENLGSWYSRRCYFDM